MQHQNRLFFVTMTETWAEATARRVAHELKRLRKDVLGMSVARLAERTKDIGHPISVNTITDLELGRRSRLEVTELFVLARALEVPPAVLLFPGLPDRQAEVLPGWSTTASHASEWLVGETTPQRETAEELERLEAGRMLSELSRRIDIARVEEMRAVTAAHHLPKDAPVDEVEKAAQWVHHTNALVDSLAWQIDDLGGETTSAWLRLRSRL